MGEKRKGRKFTGKSVNAKYGNVYKLHETGRRTANSEQCGYVDVWLWMLAALAFGHQWLVVVNWSADLPGGSALFCSCSKNEQNQRMQKTEEGGPEEVSMPPALLAISSSTLGHVRRGGGASFGLPIL